MTETRRGRPQKYTEDRVALIVQAIEAGATFALAAAYGGISEDTLSRWRKKYADFAERLARAESKGAVVNLSRIQQAATGDWRAAAWILEHRFPEHYGRSKDGAGANVNITLQVMLRAAVERVAAQQGLDAEEVLAEAEQLIAAGAP